MHRSLVLRLIVYSIGWIVVALLATGLLITQLYRHHVQDHYDAHVRAHVEELVAAADPDPNGKFRLLSKPTDPAFQREGSGWYWTVWWNNEPVARSRSLGARELTLASISMEEGTHAQVVTGPGGEPLRVQVAQVSLADDDSSLIVVATAPALRIADDVRDFRFVLASSLAALGLGILAAVAIQVLVALRPLKRMRAAISDVRDGRMQRLDDDYPADIQPMVDELNNLIAHNAALLKRARTQLGDLAHAVKNPLTVIRNAARELPGPEGTLILDQSHAMVASIDHCLLRARMYGRRDAMGQRTPVAPVLEDVCFTVGQLYMDRGVELECDALPDIHFLGDLHDLEEMAGNLVENAGKWARSRIRVTALSTNGDLEIRVDDDGPGIPEAERRAVLKRGKRLDEAAPGHGQGLGIVGELSDLYGGDLSLHDSPLGGLRATLRLPAA